jgi:S1-C subfamily serine protease
MKPPLPLLQRLCFHCTQLFRRLPLFIVFSLLTLSLKGQVDVEGLNGYKYVYVTPIKYQDGSYDKFALMSYCNKKFYYIGFDLLDFNNLSASEKVNKRCLTLFCQISHTGNAYGKNSLTLRLKNCNNEIVFENEVQANGATWAGETTIAKVLDKCIKRVFEPLDKLKYSYDPKLTPGSTNITIENTNETEETLKKYYKENALNEIEGIYKSIQTNDLSYYKIAIKRFDEKYKAIILESDIDAWKLGEVKAYLEPSSTEGIFSAKWYKGNKTPQESFLTLENGGFYIFLSSETEGQTIKNAFIKMYPISSNISKGESSIAVTGSGFFISAEGLVATNAHVISGMKKFAITIRNDTSSNSYNAKVLLSDSKNDVAILKIDDPKFKNFTSLPYGVNENPDIGEKVFTIGYPLNDIMGENYKVTDGIISSKSGINDDVRYLQISVPVQPGNSGGPLFNKHGNIVGITTSRLNQLAVGTQIENVNYAIKISYLLTLYNMLPNSLKITDRGSLSGIELTEQIKVLKNYVCLIEAK